MEEGNSSNKNNLTSSMKNKSRVSKLANGSNGKKGLPRSRSGRPPRHPSSTTNEGAGRRREQEQHHIPISNAIRVMRQILPASAKISDDAKETIQECISKFIAHISEEANRIRTEEVRKVVTADDIVAAMSKKGFESYADVLSTYLYRYREAEGKNDFTHLLRMRLSRPIVLGPDAGMVPPPVMADPYFYPHDGLSIAAGAHGQYVNAPGTGGMNADHGYGMTVIGGGHVYGSTIDSTMTNFDAGSHSSYGSTVNSTVMNFDAGRSCNNIGGGCNEYDAHWYGVTGIGESVVIGGGGGGSGQYADHCYGVGIGGGGVGENVHQGYASTINNTMMNFGVLESSTYNYNDDNVLLEYNDVFDGLLPPNSTQNV